MNWFMSEEALISLFLSQNMANNNRQRSRQHKISKNSHMKHINHQIKKNVTSPRQMNKSDFREYFSSFHLQGAYYLEHSCQG